MVQSWPWGSQIAVKKIRRLYCWQPAQRYDLKQIFEEGKYCAYKICKHRNLRSKNL